MEKNLYWVKLSVCRDAQDTGRGKRISEHFISATPNDFEQELKKAKAAYWGEVVVESIARL